MYKVTVWIINIVQSLNESLLSIFYNNDIYYKFSEEFYNIFNSFKMFMTTDPVFLLLGISKKEIFLSQIHKQWL